LPSRFAGLHLALRERGWKRISGSAIITLWPTDRVSAEVPLSGELIRQEALLDKLFATVPGAVVVLDTDDSILRVNPEFTRIFGYAEEEALGRTTTS